MQPDNRTIPTAKRTREPLLQPARVCLGFAADGQPADFLGEIFMETLQTSDALLLVETAEVFCRTRFGSQNPSGSILTI